MLFFAVIGAGCLGQSSGRGEGGVSQKTQDVKITGSITLSSTVASSVVFSTTKELDAQNQFAFTGVTPGIYVLKITVSETPCFLGAPGAVFNGMSVFWQKGWTGTGLSFKDGSSAIIGTTDAFTVTVGGTVKQSLTLPTCY
jgi:hypothetical protein